MPSGRRAALVAILCVVGLVGCAAPVRYVASPSFTPDGAGLALNLCNSDDGCKIAIFDLASARLREFKPPSRTSWFAPVYSSDGTRLAFSVAAESRPYAQLAIMNVDGSGYRVLTEGNIWRGWPSFSPDGRRLIYARSTSFSRQRPYGPINSRIYEIDIATGVERPLTRPAFSRPSRPFYLPDGRRFIFSSPPAFDATDDNRQFKQLYGDNTIFVMDETNNRLMPAFTQGSESARPAISQDGRRIVFLAPTNAIDGVHGFLNFDVFVREADANRRITRLGTFISYVAMAPAGTQIAIIDDKKRNGVERLWVMRIDGSDLREIRIPDWTQP